MRRQLPALVALITAIVWGVNFPFLKIALAELSPLAFTFWRYLLMLALAWAVLAWQHRRTGMPVTVEPADYPRLALAGVLGFSLYMVFSIVGVSETTAFSNALMIALAPLFSALLLFACMVAGFGLTYHREYRPYVAVVVGLSATAQWAGIAALAAIGPVVCGLAGLLVTRLHPRGAAQTPADSERPAA